MKIIGLIGGMSWESSAEYYRLINEEVKNQLGGLHSAKCILFSVDFEEIERYQSIGDWKSAGLVLANAAISLEKVGADFIVICTNTMHKVIDLIEEKIQIPILHIADTTAIQIKANSIQKVGLLGTKFTMEQDFYKSRVEQYNIQIIVPAEEERAIIHQIIYDELCLGIIKETSKKKYLDIIDRLVERGAKGIILGCTEVGLIIKQQDTKIPLFDTTKIHAIESVKLALQ
ncbi:MULTISPECIES: aspartate/glutamate racemase family protein [unclassified Viridibacillus]|uniref:aspartate/glutamate racemase family protein n=1 Tax=unclassified Viridibacillus TaxID=2617942 RepID=UPI00096DD222|nr:MULTISPECIES: aspartate/glutamate racemase family protein [unclassified Viridibacillus]OMC83902.1 aspartate racemase [Viridibacillus sp. FSL H8-0123]OMC88423.1 aspartate racemase [Viridibacillus sp. FSL H7-0596]